MQIQSTIRPQNAKPAKAQLIAGGKNEQQEKDSDGPTDILGINTTGIGVGAAASLAGAAYPSTWAHEMGHAKMIELMYDGANPTVEVFPFKGGVTRWSPAKLSEVGEKFGANGARAAVSAAGTMVDLGIATASFGVGFKMRKKHPVIGTAMMAYGGMTVLNSIGYAATAVGGDLAKLAREGNDFANIAVRLGVPPLASIAVMAAILPLEYAALRFLEKQGL
jgi:hypothetical protein